MGLVITKEAAVFLLRQITRDPVRMPQPLRLSVNRGLGCGDVGHIFTFGASLREGDVEIAAEGLRVICNIGDCPEFEHAAITIARNGTGPLASEKVLVIPDGAHVCGCGESATMPKKE